MKTKITRRQLAGTLLAATAAAQAQQPLPANPAEELQAARDQNQRTADTLAKTAVPMDTEPAFHFSP